jgi:peroxiredoxin Q/BCP
MLVVGDRAPDFSLATGDGSVIALKQLHGKMVVLYFYPKDDTGGCTTQACEFRDEWNTIQRTGVVLLGVSPDSAASHRKFQKKFQLPFPLLVDEGHRLADAFGVWGEKVLFGYKYLGVLRTTFILDGDGIIRHVFEAVKPKGHTAQVIEQLGRLSGKETG